VDESYRIILPQPLLSQVHWITGSQPINAWLLIGNAGRCRVLSAAELETDPDLQSLQSRIVDELTPSGSGLLEFRDAISATLPLRLIPIKIKRHGPRWRLALPRHVAAMMQLRPQESDIAALFLDEHIELWTIETLKAAVNTPLTQII
jgi:hypothetical protein